MGEKRRDFEEKKMSNFYEKISYVDIYKYVYILDTRGPKYRNAFMLRRILLYDTVTSTRY